MGDLLMRLALRENQQQRGWSEPCRFRFVRQEGGFYRLEVDPLMPDPARAKDGVRRWRLRRP